MRTINHIGVSGGKDSTALLLWAIHESGYPRDSVVASFCDTGNENQITMDYVQMLSEQIHPIVTIKPERDFYDLAKWKRRFPSRKARFCTQHLKMLPTQLFVQSLCNETATVLLHSGVRAAESADRAKLPEREWDGYFALEVYRPLIKWTLLDVWAIHDRYGVPRNPLYAMGFKRVGCFPCINSCKDEVRLIAKHFPERIDMLRKAETTMQCRNGFSSFFARKTVTARHRSKEIETKAGKKMFVPTIDDVVRWSKTERGGKQYSLGLDWLDNTSEDDKYISCPSALGQCE